MEEKLRVGKPHCFLGIEHRDAEGTAKTSFGKFPYHVMLSESVDLKQEELEKIVEEELEKHKSFIKIPAKYTGLLNNFLFDSIIDLNNANNQGYLDGINLRTKNIPKNSEEARLYLRGYVYGKFMTNMKIGPKSKLP
jgi:hypothetical protein